MRTKKSILLALTAFIVVVSCLSAIIIINNHEDLASISVKNTNAASWKEIPIKDEKMLAYSYASEFDLKKTITDADYVFEGTVVSRKEYEVDWVDDNGEQWGPFPSSVIEVKINKEYYGKSPVEDDIIRVYYPYSLSTVFDGSVIIEDEGEYVFITQALDEEFVKQRRKEVPEDKFEQEKYADVYISSPSYSLMPIDDGMVFMYHDYFEWDNRIMKKVESDASIKTNKVSSPELIDTGWFIALNEKDFDKSFLQLFERVEELPNADGLRKLHNINNSSDLEKTQVINNDAR